MNRNIIVNGSTGFIGKILTKQLSEKGYSVISLSRNILKSKDLLPWCSGHLSYDDTISLQNSINSSYGIINLAGAPIAGGRWTDDYKAVILSSRIESTKLLVNLINNSATKPKVFVNASAIGIYGDTSDKIVSENNSAGDGFLAEVTDKWEKEALKLNEPTRLVLARIGIVLERNGGALEKMVPPFKLFIGGPLGNGRQWMSWVHLDDIINQFLFVLENENLSGAVNFTAPNPVSMNEFAKILGKVLSRPSIFRVPEFILKIILGESASMVLNSNRVVPSKLIENNYQFKYQNLHDALSNIFRK